jgi:uncharacterized protein (TIGR03032 family)
VLLDLIVNLSPEMTETLPPFSCTHSPDLPELLHALKCTIAISTYQAGKVIFVSAPDPSRLVQLPRNFEKPMGLAINKKHLAIATRDQVVVMTNAPQMAKNFPPQPGIYDSLFLPRAIYFTGETDIHDLIWDNEKLWAVNTRFSCLATIDSSFSFRPSWKPPFIETITPTDQCHLNGVAFENNKPRYVTALGKTIQPEGWRAGKLTGGILFDIEKNSILSDGLPMPHSPRLFDERLFVLLSATGDLAEVDRANGKIITTKNFNGFVRGMDKIGDYVFIGLSKLRTTSSAFKDLPIASKSVFAGIVALHLPTKSIVGHIKYENSVEEIYDVKILHDMIRPGIVSPEKAERKIAVTTPGADYWAVNNEDELEKK